MNWLISRGVGDQAEFWDGKQFVADKALAKPFPTQDDAGVEAFQIQVNLRPDILSEVLNRLWPR
jgi:hypothetical protein